MKTMLSKLLAVAAVVIFAMHVAAGAEANKSTVTFDSGAEDGDCLFYSGLTPTVFGGTGGANWFLTDDGWRSGAINKGKTTHMEATVQGAELVSFNWKISADKTDTMRFCIDTTNRMAYVNGVWDWSRVTQLLVPGEYLRSDGKTTFSLDSGAHTLRWEYEKKNKIAGEDCGWVDQITIARRKRESVETLESGTALLAPTVTREGYALTGWLPAIPATVPAEDVTYTAQWTPNKYTMTFDANGGEGSMTETLDYGTALSAPTVTREGYTLTGWQPAIPASVPASNVTYTAQWEINQYTITFDVGCEDDGCVFVSTLMPTYFSSNREDWHLDDDGAWRSGSISHSESNRMEAVVRNYATQISFRWKVSSEERKDKLRFCIDANRVDWISGARDWSQKAYSLEPGEHKITCMESGSDTMYSLDYGEHRLVWEYEKNNRDNIGEDCGWVDSIEIAERKRKEVVTLDYGETIVAPKVTRTGCTFIGWSPEFTGHVPAEDVTYTAQWTPNKYTVTFDANGGTGGKTEELYYGSPLVAPEVTPREGWTFVRWEPKVPPKVPAEDITYRALWTNIKNVKARQRLWEVGKVDISYEVMGEFDVPVEISITATNPVVGTNWTVLAISGDTGSQLGRHSILWDMAAQELDVLSSDLEFTVEYVKKPAPYVAIDISGGVEAESYPVTELYSIPSGGWTDEYKTEKLVMRRIEPGLFMMQSTSNVTISQSFYIGVFETTQRQWELVMGDRPSGFSNELYYATRPVERVAYNRICGDFMRTLCNKVKTNIKEFNLPTEAQWEYACRAGTSSDYNNGGNSTNDLLTLGRYMGNSGDFNGADLGSCETDKGTAAVGSYAPNAWGLYDMHGNVWEWCLDAWAENPAYGIDPVNTSSNGTSLVVVRGGDWQDKAEKCTSLTREGRGPADYYALNTRGFRLAGNIEPDVASSRSVQIDGSPYAWAEKYHGFSEMFGSFSSAFVQLTGKKGCDGGELCVWHDFVAGTDPSNMNDVLRATIKFDGDTGNPVIGWMPELTPEETEKRVYRKHGKKRLDDAWSPVDGNEADYNFFKVTVEMK